MPPSDDTVTTLPSLSSTDQHLLILRIILLMLMAILFGIGVFYVISAVVGAVVLASVVSLVIILFTAVLFIGYDALRNHQQVANNLVLESKRLFVRYVSHEIRSPLNTVHLGLKLLVQEMQEAQSTTHASPLTDTGTGDSEDDCSRVINAKLEEWITLIEEIGVSTERVVTVLNELIHSDDLASGTLRVSKKSVDLWEVVESSVQQMRGQAVQSGVSLSLDVEVKRADMNQDYVSELKQLRVVGDASKLEQVVCMLVGASMKKARSGGQVIVTVFWDPDEECEDAGDDTEEKADHQDGETSYEAAGSMVVTVVCSPVLDTPAVPSPHLSPESKQLNIRDGMFDSETLHATNSDGHELGLWIAKGIIELHHGRFSVITNDDNAQTGAEDEYDKESKATLRHVESLSASDRSAAHIHNNISEGSPPVVGQQCCFRIELPAIVVTAEEDYDDTFSITSDELKEAEAASTDSILMDLSYNVLVVDDSTSSRKLLCRLLSNLGCRCTQAQNGVECIEIVHRNQRSHSQPPFDFILLDYEMPRLNGPDAARTLRREGIFTPIIGVTGNVLPEDQQYFQHAGANCVLRKPLSLPSLEKALMDIIMRNDEISYIL
eukprot:CAMPEP_0114425678 /NCGR_PEP_ID=MMETSP0103-20121206/7368_1 /TAXON_ID=37642 ORGANISM="Paraphysomonas imperforata, Strain PA2" /NCGR_SAMPLE_ID=MMETSP0103 /ASSEMBLY_ACC=CAM_ASM_000201 /LENGTH=606 /DNA_ID=CAMNT_0001594539 /DNA_START=2198 /DNA_END=4018 /DNA_ORIENTATION=+